MIDARTNAVEPATPIEPSFVDPYAEFVGPVFPVDVLPPTLANFVDAQYRAMGADPAAIAMDALTAVAGAMNAETRVRVGEGWWEKPIIWTALIGQPSAMKSPVIDKVTKPLSSIDFERHTKWRQDHAAWLKNKATNKKLPPPNRPARCVINDSTSEKIAELLFADQGSPPLHAATGARRQQFGGRARDRQARLRAAARDTKPWRSVATR